jgi:A/G-specific adenine glycosylase
MPALPGSEWSDVGLQSVNGMATIRHVFTHFSLDLAIVPRGEREGEGWWQPLDRIDQAGLPTLYRKAIGAALASNDRIAA